MSAYNFLGIIITKFLTKVSRKKNNNKGENALFLLYLYYIAAGSGEKMKSTKFMSI